MFTHVCAFFEVPSYAPRLVCLEKGMINLLQKMTSKTARSGISERVFESSNDMQSTYVCV